MSPSPTTHRREHIEYFDYLRVLAACSIVLLHVSAQNWDAVSVDSAAWQIFNLANSAGRWAVPVFLMISGALFLDNDRPLDTGKLWKTSIFRMLTLYVIWSAIYALDSLSRGASPEKALRSFLEGKYHMWYLLTIAGLYIVTPLVRRLTESRQLTRYYLGVSGLFLILIPRLWNLVNCLEIPFLAGFLPSVEQAISQFHFSFGQIYLFYYVLGYYLRKYGLPVVPDKLLLPLGAAGYLCTVLLTGWYSRKTGTGVTTFYALNSLNVLCMSTAAFLFGRNILSGIPLPQRLQKSVRTFSGCTLGIYLIHPLVIDFLKHAFGLHTLTLHPALAVPGITLLVLLICRNLAALLRRIPYTKKYLV